MTVLSTAAPDPVAPPPSALLRRLPPTPPVARPSWRTEIIVTGELEHGATLRVEPATGRAGISLYIHQDGETDILATIWFDSGPDAVFEAQRRAAELRRGALVQVKAHGVRKKWDHDVLIFELVLAHALDLLESAP